MCILRDNRLKDVEKLLVFEKRVRGWRELCGGADGQLGLRWGFREEGEDVAVYGSSVWEDILDIFLAADELVRKACFVYDVWAPFQSSYGSSTDSGY